MIAFIFSQFAWKSDNAVCSKLIFANKSILSLYCEASKSMDLGSILGSIFVNVSPKLTSSTSNSLLVIYLVLFL